MKKFVRAVLILLITAIVIGGFSSCEKKTEGDVVLSAEGDAILVLDGGTIQILPKTADKKETALTLENRTQSDVSITLFYGDDDGKSVELKAESEETVTQSLELYEENVSLVNAVAIGKTAYVINENGLIGAVKHGFDVLLLDNVNVDTLTLTAPVKIDTGDYALSASGVINLVTTQAGEFTLCGNVTAKSFTAKARECRITVPDSLVPENANLFIDAISVNGTLVSDMPILKSMEDFKLLLTDGTVFTRDTDSETIKLCDFDVTEDVTVNWPVKLLAENVGGSGKIVIKTEKAGDIYFDGIDPDRIVIDAPAANLIIDAPVYDTAVKYKLKSVNGYDVTEIAKSESFTVPTLTFDGTKWTYKGGELFAKAKNIIKPSVWHDAKIKPTAGGATWSVCDWCKSENGINLLSENGAAIKLSDGEKVQIVPINTEFNHILPVVEINVEGKKKVESKEDWLRADFSLDASMCDGYDFDCIDTVSCQISGRGNSTWDWSEKKPYKIKLDKKASVLGMHEAQNWVLLANYMDKSLIRNYVALECAKILDAGDNYATQFPVNLYVNGEYVGVYSIGEKVEQGAGRSYIRENAYSVDTGFILELNGADSSDADGTFKVPGLGPVTVQYPGLNILTDKQLTYISNYMTLASSAVKKRIGWEEYIDIDALVDWYIMIEFSYNSDSCLRRSVFFEKDTGGKIVMGQPWDFDLAFGNSRADGGYDQWAALVNNSYVGVNWMTYLMQEDEFYDALKSRWEEKKDDLLASALAAVDEGYRLVKPSAAENFKKWDILYMQTSMEPWYVHEHTTYDGQVEYLKNFITTRWHWIDETLSRDTAPTVNHN